MSKILNGLGFLSQIKYLLGKPDGKKEGNIVSKLSFKLAKLIDGENVIGIEAK
jgi:hypothetical protein